MVMTAMPIVMVRSSPTRATPRERVGQEMVALTGRAMMAM